MSGTNSGISELTPAVSATTDATIPDAQAGGTAPGQGASGIDVLTQDTWTRRLVAVASVVVVGLSILFIVGVMGYRVILDGNSALTNDITTKLMWVALVGIGSMIAALFGQNALVSKAIDKIGL